MPLEHKVGVVLFVERGRAVDDGRALCLQPVKKFGPSFRMPPKHNIDRSKPESSPRAQRLYFRGLCRCLCVNSGIFCVRVLRTHRKGSQCSLRLTGLGSRDKDII